MVSLESAPQKPGGLTPLRGVGRFWVFDPGCAPLSWPTAPTWWEDIGGQSGCRAGRVGSSTPGQTFAEPAFPGAPAAPSRPQPAAARAPRVPAPCKWGTFVSLQLRPSDRLERAKAGSFRWRGRAPSTSLPAKQLQLPVLEHCFCYTSLPFSLFCSDLCSWESVEVESGSVGGFPGLARSPFRGLGALASSLSSHSSSYHLFPTFEVGWFFSVLIWIGI